MLKAFVYGINQFLLVYIPTKFRTEIKAKKNIFELKLLEEVTDEEDYAKFDEFQIKYVHEKTDKDTYNQMLDYFFKFLMDNTPTEVAVMGGRTIWKLYMLPVDISALKNFDEWSKRFKKYINASVS